VLQNPTLQTQREKKKIKKLQKGPNFKSGKRKIPISDPPPTFGTLPSIKAFSSNQNQFIQFGISSNLLLHNKPAFHCARERKTHQTLTLEREEERKKKTIKVEEREGNTGKRPMCLRRSVERKGNGIEAPFIYLTLASKRELLMINHRHRYCKIINNSNKKTCPLSSSSSILRN